MSKIDDVLAHIDANIDESLARLDALVRFKSISTDPAYKDECQKAAAWLVKELNDIGFSAEMRETPGHPMVVAHDSEGGDKPGPRCAVLWSL